MQEKPTTQLLDIFEKTSMENLGNYLMNYGRPSAPREVFNNYLAQNPHITQADIVRRCQGFVSRSYIYDLMSGKKTAPSRDIVLMLCLAAHMDRKMTRRMLEIFCHRDLYLKDSRDIVIAMCINQKIFDIHRVNDKLSEHGLPLLEG